MARTLVVGSVHLDVIGVTDDDSSNIDKIGGLKFSVGGAAFNIAANLASKKVEVALLSTVRSQSYGESLIKAELLKRHILRKFIVRNPFFGESGFVAHMRKEGPNGVEVLTSAISRMAIEEVALDHSKLDEAIKWSSVVAIDANLNERQIKQIATICHDRKKPLLVCCVSESKVKRVYGLWDSEEPHFSVVFMNGNEAAKAGFGLGAVENDKSLQHKMLKAFSAHHIMITEGGQGYWVISAQANSTPTCTRFASIHPRVVVSTLGAGDVLFASVVAMGRRINWEEHANTIGDYLMPVLASNSAAPEVAVSKFNVSAEEMLSGDSFCFGLICLSVGFLLVGAFGPIHSPLLLATTFLAMALSAGGCGALVIGRLNPERFQSSRQDAIMGAVAGLIAAILLGTPNFLAGFDNEAIQMILMKRLMFSEIVVSFVAGMTSQAYLKRLIGTFRPPEKEVELSTSVEPKQDHDKDAVG